MALSVAVLGVTGCGGSSSAPTAGTPDPAAAPPAGPSGSTTSVSTGGGGGGDNIGRDIAKEHKESEAALRVWGKQANKLCRKVAARDKVTTKRLEAMLPKGRRFTRPEQEKFGRVVLEYGRQAEKDYFALRDIALPKQAEALDKIQSYFDKVEESLTLAQRFGIEVEEARSLPDMILVAKRIKRLEDDLKRDARTVKAPACASDKL